MKIEIKYRYENKVKISGEYASVKECCEKNNANLYNADLSYADLYNANLSNANLYNADLSYADLSYADLYNANLYNANLYNADLYNADLSYADLSYANLYNANLYNANLSYADLYNANLYNANLSNADLLGIKNYSEAHPVFFELVRKEKAETFTQVQWSIIGQIQCHTLCWDSIKKRFGKGILPVFEVLAKKGFGEFLEKYTNILND